MNEAQFWMVWNPAGHSPVFKHETARLARIEAERLARLNPGQRFYVLEAVALRYVDDMIRVDLRPGNDDQDDLPF